MGKYFLKLSTNLSRKQWALVHLAAISLLILTLFQVIHIHQSLQFKMLDIGQGDALLIQTPEHKNILIDAGYDGAIIDRLSEELGFFDKTIDLFILSHSHRDHYAGLLEVLNKYKIKQTLVTGAHSDDILYQYFLDEIRKKDIPIHLANNQKDVHIGTNLYLDILFPFSEKSVVGQRVHNKNNVSIVARLMQKTNVGWKPLVMLTGDAEIEEERDLLLSDQNLSANVLKVGHHGSRTATSDNFLEAVSPKTSLISAGQNNSFNHPHEETMDKLAEKEIKTHITAEEGTIIINF